ncbi:arsenate reductase ArsC [Hydrogenophilus thermoluteolus]|uniref:Fusion protein of osmotically inducible protein C and low molecular weight phosphatase family protein n=1 Tax=Hydrogenophilus thermoluteolus TaxID=297 RepID=A0A2Z6DZI3_HYDTE|nr:arsenate reductase ArsC [Hydrogenophilus thermoluteolus]BBD77941.1 fusion protein of osmotically inducible protein C and low molecular weight phosphatase family protein [Hydrogenophilus thermoluteolus]
MTEKRNDPSKPPMVFDVWAERGTSYGIARTKNATVILDTDMAGRHDAFNPAELLLAALSACMLKGVERIIPILNFSLRHVAIRLHGERRDVPPALARICYTIGVDSVENDRRLDLLHENLRKYGTVFNTIAPGTQLSGSIHRMKRVLVLCTGNSCRSQMAEAILNHDLAPFVRAFSAGVAPQSEVAPNALEALRRAELPTEGLAPKDVAQFLDEPFDLVVTVCDHAREACPVFPRPIPTLHMAFPDPHGQPLAAFEAVRDAIRAHLVPAVAQALAVPFAQENA